MLVKESPTNLRTYKTKIASVSPQRNRNNFEEQDACFLGVSLDNKNFEPSKFCSMIEWVAKRFPRCQILIGDSIHRITLELRDGINTSQAETRALALGQQFIIDNTHIVNTYGANTHFEFISCNKIQKTTDYRIFHDHISTYFSEIMTFRDSIERFSRHYHQNVWQSITETEREYRIKRSCDYFIEEFAIFACLIKNNNHVMAYPGAFSTSAEITQGHFPGIGQELEALTLVSLQLKKR